MFDDGSMKNVYRGNQVVLKTNLEPKELWGNRPKFEVGKATAKPALMQEHWPRKYVLLFRILTGGLGGLSQRVLG